MIYGIYKIHQASVDYTKAEYIQKYNNNDVAPKQPLYNNSNGSTNELYHDYSTRLRKYDEPQRSVESQLQSNQIHPTAITSSAGIGSSGKVCVAKNTFEHEEKEYYDQKQRRTIAAKRSKPNAKIENIYGNNMNNDQNTNTDNKPKKKSSKKRKRSKSPVQLIKRRKTSHENRGKGGVTKEDAMELDTTTNSDSNNNNAVGDDFLGELQEATRKWSESGGNLNNIEEFMEQYQSKSRRCSEIYDGFDHLLINNELNDDNNNHNVKLRPMALSVGNWISYTYRSADTEENIPKIGHIHFIHSGINNTILEIKDTDGCQQIADINDIKYHLIQ